MAFTKITAAGIGSTETVTLDGLSVINNGSFGGNLTVGGVLTYEDVTNVDSVGLITARNGIVVGSGITLSKDGDIFATGITTVSGNVKVGTGVTLSPDGDAFFTGVITATSYSGIDLSDVTGATGDFSIADKIVHTGDTDTTIRFPAADTIAVETGGVERLEITGTEVVFNDTGTDTDFRIEGDSDANLFKVDASADAIGVGAVPITTGPKFEVTRSTSDAFVNATDCVARLINSDTSANTNQTSLQFTTSTTSSGADSAIVSQAEDASGNSRLEFWTDTSNGMTEKASIDSSGHLTISDGNLVVGTSGHGIDFSATADGGNGNATTVSELLDYYEEGTWVPSITMSNGGMSIGYAFRYGTYVRIGRMVHVEAYIGLNAISSNGSGYMKLVNFPFTSETGDVSYGGMHSPYYNNLNNRPMRGALVERNDNFAYVYMDFETNGTIDNATVAALFTTSSQFVLVGSYVVPT